MSKKSKPWMSLFTLIMISSAFVTSIRNLPTIAETGMQMFFFGILAALVFFIPAALISAELATGWPKMGGIAVWIEEAFGDKWGFIGIWFQWTYMIISVIAMLYFISGSLAFVFTPHLSDNKIYLIVMSLVLIWAFTFLNLKGLHLSSLISTIGFLAGVLFPAILIIAMGLIYIFQGNPLQLDISLTKNNLLPDFKNLSTLVLIVGFMRAFAGIEASAVHANSVKNPQRNYPLSILIVVIIGLAVNILGSLSVAIVIPQSEISLVSGIMEAFRFFFKTFNLEFIIPFLGLAVAIGQMGGLSTWLMGPVKSLLQTARKGQLPIFFQKVNKHDAPSRLMILQAILISILSTFFLLMGGSVNIAFWISVALSMLLYVSMYFLMMLSGLWLRYKHPQTKRTFKIPFKNFGMWIVSVVGMLAMIFSFIIAFFPPVQLPSQNYPFYLSVLIIAIIIIFTLPFIIQHFKKPSWGKYYKKEE